MTLKMSGLLRVALTIVVFGWLGAPKASAQTFGGSVTGATVTVPATGTVIRAATGTVPIAGGADEASLMVGDIPGSATGNVVAFSAGTLHSAIVGNDATRAEASMANIALTVSGNQITSAFLLARSAAACAPAASGSTQLLNLVINGQNITVTGNPNQTVSLPNGTVVINQQTSSVAGTSASMAINALHVTTTDPITHQQLADVVLGEIDAQIDCSGGAPPSGGFGTGGGWVRSNDGVNKANFGVVVGGTQNDGSYKGHVTYYDHGTGFQLQSTSITSAITSGCTTQISGTWNNAGTPATFTLNITDNGEPGAGHDTFELQAGYTNFNLVLEGGNIQSHPSCQ